MGVTNNLIYNSQKEDLTIPEYGRNVQELVKYCKTIEDPEMKQAVAEEVVDLMYRMSGTSRSTPEFRNKLWKHFFHIANYEIDVKPPEGVEIDKEEIGFHPEMPEYPSHTSAFRHYGLVVQNMLKKALEMEDGPIKDQFIEVIGSYMKMAYRTWNKEHYVSDEIIKEDLKSMSKGEIDLGVDATLNYLKNQGGHVANTTHDRDRRRKGGRNSGRDNRGRNYKPRRRR